MKQFSTFKIVKRDFDNETVSFLVSNSNFDLPEIRIPISFGVRMRLYPLKLPPIPHYVESI